MLKVLLVLGTLVSSILGYVKTEVYADESSSTVQLNDNIRYEMTPIALTEEQIALMNSLHAECVSQSKVAEDVVSAAKNGNIGDDNNLKCYMKCILDELGVIDDDEKIDVDGVVAMLPEEMQEFAPAVLKKCGTQSGADLCDSIFNTFKCYYETDKRVFFLP